MDDAPPIWMIPFCASCGDGVDTFTLHAPDERGMAVEAICHGKTEGGRFSPKDLMPGEAGQKRLVMFKRGQGFDRTR